MWKQPRSALIRHLMPFLAIAVALCIQGALAVFIPKEVDFPYAFLYLIAVFVVAWFAGYVPGVTACLLIMVGLPYLAPGHHLQVDPGRLGFMLAVSIGISRVAETQRRAREVLRDANELLDLRVKDRTAELGHAVEDLRAEVAKRRQTEERLERQLERLNLLDQITRAIGERQDLHSIFQVTVGSLEENLPVDFACVCLNNPSNDTLTVTCVGTNSEPLAMDLALHENTRIEIDEHALTGCVRGNVVYEPDIASAQFRFPQRLASGGLRAMAAAPLRVESEFFGVLIAARRESRSFTSGDCEFLRQLSEHVALAAHQAQVHDALQKAYEDLRQTQQSVMQQERLRALGQMASGIAHDINNAISPVVLYTEMLLESEPDLSNRTRDYLETTRRAVGDVAQTVSRMSEFYRQREHQLATAPVDLNRLVQQVTDLTRAKWMDLPQQRGIVIRMRMDIEPALGLVDGVESEIREALTNLVFNGVDAMPSGGDLTLRTRMSPGLPGKRRIHVEAVDTGIGMDEETRRRCLEPFFTTKGERGTGLGLAMVYGTAQRHGAEVEMESEPGKGTTMRLSFPERAPNSTSAAAPASGPVDAVPQRLRILVVDDDPILIKSLRDILESDGHAVTTANGGQAGIDTFREREARGEIFAVVITDLGMPHIDGRRVAAAIKETRRTTPVILLTGWGERLVAEQDIPPYVDRVLGKPPKLRELRTAMAELTATKAIAAGGFSAGQ